MAKHAQHRFDQSDEIIKQIEKNNEYVYDSAPSVAIINVLGCLGYTLEESSSDIVDNSDDAEADNVWVKVGNLNGSQYIDIADDGYGMNAQTLCSSMVMAGTPELGKKESGSLGKFHMGLNTSVLSRGGYAEIYSKQVGTPLLKTIFSKDEILKTGSFKMRTINPTQDEIDYFNESIDSSESGTLVRIIGKEVLNTTVKTAKSKLVKTFGRKFRRYLMADKHMYVNNIKVPAYDPMYYSIPLVYQGKKHKSEQIGKLEFNDIEYTDKDGNLKNDGRLVYTSYSIYNPGDRGFSVSEKINVNNQGIYVMRNDREIMAGTFLDLPKVTKNPGYNYFRAELEFGEELDELFQLNIQKTKIIVDQSIKDKIVKQVKSDIDHVWKVAQKAKESKVQKNPKEIEKLHKSLQDHVNRKGKLLPRNKRKKTTKKTKRPVPDPNRVIIPRKQKTYKHFLITTDDTMGSRDAIHTGRLLDDSKDLIELTFNTNHKQWEHLLLLDEASKNYYYYELYALYKVRFEYVVDSNGGIDYDLINHMDNVMGMTTDTLLDGAKKPTLASA